MGEIMEITGQDHGMPDSVVSYVDVALVWELSDRTFMMNKIQTSSLKYYITSSSNTSNCNLSESKCSCRDHWRALRKMVMNQLVRDLL
jgi:hypothetical protein